MQLYVTVWEKKDEDEKVTDHAEWSSSDAAASKIATRVKAEDGVVKKSVKRFPVEVDTRKEGLLAILNAISKGAAEGLLHITLNKLVKD